VGSTGVPQKGKDGLQKTLLSNKKKQGGRTERDNEAGGNGRHTKLNRHNAKPGKERLSRDVPQPGKYAHTGGHGSPGRHVHEYKGKARDNHPRGAVRNRNQREKTLPRWEKSKLPGKAWGSRTKDFPRVRLKKEWEKNGRPLIREGWEINLLYKTTESLYCANVTI